mgnify:CR=1 FL=1
MHSFEVFEISVGPALLGMGHLPGLQGNFLADVEKIFNWKPAAIISLTEKKEMEDLGASNFISLIEKEKIPWLHFPIKDFGIVDKQREVLWEPISQNIHHPSIFGCGQQWYIACHDGQTENVDIFWAGQSE